MADFINPQRNLFERFRPAPAPAFPACCRRCRPMAACRLGPRARTGRRKASAAWARSKCGWRRPPPKCARRRSCATACSTRKAPAVPNPARLFARRDVDAYDAVCDHLLVLDHAKRDGAPLNRPAVVGTYRLLRQPLAEEFGGFYTAGEFDIDALITRHANLQFLELGRSCVLAPYRNKRTVELLVARHLVLRAAEPRRRDDRLRQPRRHRARGGWRCRCRSCTIMRARRRPGGRARCPTAISR